MTEKIARYWKGSDSGEWHPWFPARDITQREYDGYSADEKKALDESPLYQKTEPRASGKKDGD